MNTADENREVTARCVDEMGGSKLIDNDGLRK